MLQINTSCFLMQEICECIESSPHHLYVFVFFYEPVWMIWLSNMKRGFIIPQTALLPLEALTCCAFYGRTQTYLLKVKSYTQLKYKSKLNVDVDIFSFHCF